MTKQNIIIGLAIFLIVVAPLAIIWSLNTLFPVLAIPYTFWTWLATVVLASTVTKSGVKVKS
jgi:hypothetical protein